MDFVKAMAAGLLVAAISPQAAKAEETALQQLQTARALYEIGVAAKDPLYILAAAKLRKSVRMAPGGPVPEGRSPAKGAPLQWDRMLVAADPLITGDPMLEGLAEDIRAERSKGVTNGPVYSIINLAAGGKDLYPDVPFSGGQYAEIYVEGPRGSDLNLLVHDSRGRLVCSDTDISAIAYCGWRPASDDAYAITVVSEGGRGGSYSLMTN